jgi:hypothetical protein
VTCRKTLSQGSPGEDEGSHKMPQNRQYSGHDWHRLNFERGMYVQLPCTRHTALVRRGISFETSVSFDT